MDTKLNKFGVETKDKRLGEEIKPLSEEIYPDAPRPLTVEANCVSKKEVLTTFNKLGLETKLNKFGVDTKDKRLGDEIKPLREEIYPDAPNPLTVEANWVSKKEVLTKLSKLGLETKLNKFGDDTKLNRLGLETKLNKLGLDTKLKRFGLDTRLNKLGVDT